MSICLRVSPSESEARRDPIKTCNATLGNTTKVATTNCQSDTASIDFTIHHSVHFRKYTDERLTAKREFAYTQGGNGEARISIINGSPFALTTASSACHFSFECDHFWSRLLKRKRRTMNVIADPMRDPKAAMGNPFMP